MIETTNEFCFLYSTFANKDAALATARLLIDKKLAACVNIFPPMTSIYFWEGSREEGEEFAALIKTRRSLAEAAVAAAREIHEYSEPCFLILPIEAGNANYLAWARAATEQPVSI